MVFRDIKDYVAQKTAFRLHVKFTHSHTDGKALLSVANEGLKTIQRHTNDV